MHIIADSGSTKTDWVVCQGKEIKQRIETIGFNPYYFTSDVMEKIIKSDLAPNLVGLDISDIYFYGSGCSTELNNKVIIDALKPSFKDASIFIYHDLLGAARSLFGHNEGIAGILGTGSNSAVYQQGQITHNIPSIGYMFGDEGSGSNLGKRLINAYLKEELSDDIKQKFDQQFNYSFEYILKQVYTVGNPINFFASFAPFIHENLASPSILNIVTASFGDFFKMNVCKYPDYKKLPIKFIGSIAFIYANILKEVALSFGIEITGIQKNPMEGLIDFHAV